MGAVYKARDRRIRRVVALKFIRGADERLTQRFMQEARAQARVEHPGICKVLEVGEVEGKAYIAMQFVDGMSLQQARTKLELLEKVQIIKEAAEALHVAHECGIIHRDVKPANIMVEKRSDGNYHPVVMDFGLARDTTESTGMTESGAVMGTAAFMSPEQARGEIRRLDRRSDVYSLGATLYDLLTGRPPFVASNLADALLKAMLDEPTSLRQLNPMAPEAVEIIVHKCLNKEPAQRYPTARDLAEDIERFLGNRRITAKRLGLYYRLRWRAKRNKPAVVAGVALLLSLVVLVGYGIRNRIQNIRKEQQAQRQAQLAQKLGQEIKEMEWLLRSARQLPLHDLDREVKIIRKRMLQLQGEFASYGELGQGLAHYALGRGHLALREYPQALAEIENAVQLGHDGPDVQYALGFALGKHHEQAMYEARLAGGGDWARRQLQEIEPKYLTPAIESLSRSRAMQGMKQDAPSYLDALIAYYKRDYGTAIKHAGAVREAESWMYEASKLQGDAHLERALTARDSGEYEEAEKEFAASVKSYELAVDSARSDSEVYEGLAETWVRQIEMEINRGKPTEKAYAAATAASDKLSTADPNSISGHLKKGFAAMMTMALVGVGKATEERLQQCLTETTAVLKRQPENDYARDAAANCYVSASDSAQSKGDDPEPLLRKAMELLEPAVRQNPRFLWGLNDLAIAYAALGIYLQSKGRPQVQQTFESSLAYFGKAIELDATYLKPIQNSLFIWARLVATASSEENLKRMLGRVDELYAKCMKLNDKYQQCNVNYLMVYASAAQRLMEGGSQPRTQLERAFQIQAQIMKLGGTFLDAEQFAALAHYVDASEQQRQRQDATKAIAEIDAALKRCFAQADKDALCRTLAVQIDWLKANTQDGAKKREAVLKEALRKAEALTQSPDKTPEAWQVLAETKLRQAREDGARPAERESHITEGLGAAEKALALNAKHAASLVTQGDLQLLSARAQRNLEARKTAGRLALQSYQRAMSSDPYLAMSLSERLAESREAAGRID